MQKWLRWILALMVSAAIASPAAAKETATIWVNGKMVDVMDAYPMGQASGLVPLRAVVTALGGEVWWNGETRTATAAVSGTTVQLTIGAAVARVNGKPLTLKTAPVLLGWRTHVPADLFMEAFGAPVGMCRPTAVSTYTLNRPGLLGVPVVRATPGIAGLLFSGVTRPTEYGVPSVPLDGKVLWVAENANAGRELDLTGKNLWDGTTFHERFPMAMQPEGDFPSALAFPAEGCWELSLKTGSVTGQVILLVRER